MKKDDSNVTLLDVFNRADTLRKQSLSDSLADITAPTRVEPFCMISQDLTTSPFVIDLLQTALNIIASHYIRAIPLIADIDNLKITKILKSVNPNPTGTRTPKRLTKAYIRNSLEDARMDNLSTCTESYKFGLPNKKMISNSFAIEDDRDDYYTNRKEVVDKAPDYSDKEKEREYARLDDAKRNEEERERGDRTRTNSQNKSEDRRYVEQRKQEERRNKADRKLRGVSTKVMRDFNDKSNLAVGKLVEISFNSDRSSYTIPVSINLSTLPIDNELLANIMSGNTLDNSISSRIFKLRAGSISFWNDFVFCNDIIKERNRLMRKDKHDILSSIRARKNNALISAAVDNERNYAVSSNIVIASTDVIRMVEKKHRGKLSNLRVRSTIFEDLSAMVIIEVNVEYEQVIVYHKGIDNPSTLPLRGLSVGKRDDMDKLNEIITALTVGRTPQF